MRSRLDLRLRRGFTMVEIMVAGAIGVMLLGILYSIFSGSTNVSRRVEGKNELIQSATLAAEVLKRDLSELVSLPQSFVGGAYVPRLGDNRNPVLITPDGRQISFYVPVKGDDRRTAEGKIRVEPVNYRLLPVAREGSADAESPRYFFVRSRGIDATKPEEAAQVATGLHRNIGAVYLEDAQFKLLSPYQEDLEYRVEKSPDQNFYVVAELRATTSGTAGKTKSETSQDTLDLRIVVPLDQPSQVARIPKIGVAGADVYDAGTVALKSGPRLVSLTPAEEKAVDDLTDAAKKYEEGDLPAADLEAKVRGVLDEIVNAKRGPNILVGPANPPDPKTLTLVPGPNGDGTVTLRGPDGSEVRIPTSPNGNGSGPNGGPGSPGPGQGSPNGSPGNTGTQAPPKTVKRTWTVRGGTFKRSWVRDPVTGELTLVSSSETGFNESGGEEITGNGDIPDLADMNRQDIDSAMTRNGF